MYVTYTFAHTYSYTYLCAYKLMRHCLTCHCDAANREPHELVHVWLCVLVPQGRKGRANKCPADTDMALSQNADTKEKWGVAVGFPLNEPLKEPLSVPLQGLLYNETKRRLTFSRNAISRQASLSAQRQKVGGAGRIRWRLLWGLLLMPKPPA